MSIRAKYMHSLGIAGIPAWPQQELSEPASCTLPNMSSSLSSCGTVSNAGSRSNSTSSCRSTTTNDQAEEDGAVCRSVSSVCSSDDSSEDADALTWPGMCWKSSCLVRGLSLRPGLYQPPKSQTVTIFDWDDTLLCTSLLTYASADNSSGHLTLPPAELLTNLAQAASDLLEEACRLGPTFIITNATEGWVEESAQRWAPALLPALGKVNEIISARSRYEWQSPDMNHWKLQAFLGLQRRLDPHPVTNLIAVGDSDIEMDAARVMATQFSRAVVKTVKLKPTPMALDLLKELELLREKLDDVVKAGSNLRIQLYRKRPSPAAGC